MLQKHQPTTGDYRKLTDDLTNSLVIFLLIFWFRQGDDRPNGGGADQLEEFYWMS